jgi:hypothetical protein
LRVFFHLDVAEFSDWGILGLVGQLQDSSARVVNAACEILEEILHDEV